MKRNLILGFGISICNLFFYALAMDLLFQSGIYLRIFGINFLTLCGSNSTMIGIVVSVIAVSLEIISYRVIRSSGMRQESSDQ